MDLLFPVFQTEGVYSSGLFHRREDFTERHSGEGGGVVGHGVGNDELALMDEAAAGVNDIGNVAFAFLFVRLDKRFAGAAKNPGGVIAIEEKSADAVFAHGADAVA